MGRRASGFEGVYSDNVWRVYGFLAYRVRDPELAQDLTQATFERALRAWSRYDDRRASQATWLLAIARNLLIDHHRRDRFLLEELSDEIELGSAGGPEQRYAGWPELQEAIGQLSEREQEVIALRFGGDLAGPEIARILDLSVANVQQILSRSIRRLRELVDAGVADDGASRLGAATSGLERSG